MASDVREQLPEGGEDGGEAGDLTLLLKVKKKNQNEKEREEKRSDGRRSKEKPLTLL